MTRTADNKLKFAFVTEESQKISSQVDVDGNGKRSVTFHLAPADYSTFTLTRRNGYSYITLSNVEELEALVQGVGKAYTVSLENLQGNIVQDDPDGDWWIDTPEPDPAPEIFPCRTSCRPYMIVPEITSVRRRMGQKRPC
jgi:hypothetical protein